MSIIYENTEQILIEIKKLMLESKTTQREIAQKLGIKPQGLTKLMNKKNFAFEDVQKIISSMGYELIIDFKKASIDDKENIAMSENKTQIEEQNPLPIAPNTISEASAQTTTSYKSFTSEEAKRIDSKELLTNIHYQAEIQSTFGFDVLKELVTHARELQQEGLL